MHQPEGLQVLGQERRKLTRLGFEALLAEVDVLVLIAAELALTHHERVIVNVSAARLALAYDVIRGVVLTRATASAKDQRFPNVVLAGWDGTATSFPRA